MAVGLEPLNFSDCVAVQVQMAQILVLGNILNLADFVLRKIHPLKRSRGREVQHVCQLVATRIQLDKVPDGGERGQTLQIVVGQIDYLQVDVLLNPLKQLWNQGLTFTEGKALPAKLRDK